MSSIGLSTFFPADAAVPSRLILRLTEVNVASLAVACFLFVSDASANSPSRRFRLTITRTRTSFSEKRGTTGRGPGGTTPGSGD